MSDLTRSSGVTAIAILTVAALLGACGDDTVTSPGASSSTAAAPGGTSGSGGSGGTGSASFDGGLTASLAGSSFENGVQTVTLRLRGTDGPLGAYQGRLVFEAGSIELESVTPSETGFHAVNDRNASEGLVRFAGFAATGFEDPDVLSFTFRTDRALSGDELSLELDVVGSLEGLEVPERNIEIERGVQIIDRKS